MSLISSFHNAHEFADGRPDLVDSFINLRQLLLLPQMFHLARNLSSYRSWNRIAQTIRHESSLIGLVTTAELATGDDVAP